LKSGKLKALPPTYSMPPIEVHAVYPSAKHVTAKVQAFVENLEERFKKLPSSTAIPSGEMSL
jgi:DNA-binding transcriptional LysR family regulator